MKTKFTRAFVWDCIVFAVCALVLIVFAAGAHAQGNFAALGVSYLPGGSPNIAGTAIYARQMNSSTYMFSVLDALPNSTKPFSITTQTGIGVAQRLFSIRLADFYIPTSAGISWTGANTGWAWSTGMLAAVHVKSNSSWLLVPSIRMVKSSIGNAGYQVMIFGFGFGWGW